MNCDDYLAMLSTLPVEELAYGHPREHAAGCHDCNRVTRVVAERERNMLLAYGEVHSAVPAAETAARARATSRRRTAAFFYRTALGVSAAATVAWLVMSRIEPAPPRGPLVSETFQLQCLSTEQAAELLRPAIRQTGRISFRPGSPHDALRVEASVGDMVRARAMLDRYDDPAASRCERR